VCATSLATMSILALFASCRWCSCWFCGYCMVFGLGLPINWVNSLLLINVRRTARFRIFRKKRSAIQYDTIDDSSLQ